MSNQSPAASQTPNKSTSLSDAVLALSQHGASVVHTTPWYRREAWLAVCMAAFLPVVLAIVAPQSWKIPLTGVSGVLMLISMLMLVVHRRQLNAAAHSLPARQGER